MTKIATLCFVGFIECLTKASHQDAKTRKHRAETATSIVVIFVDRIEKRGKHEKEGWRKREESSKKKHERRPKIEGHQLGTRVKYELS